MNLKKIAYYLGIALCLASPLAFGICSLEAEMTENTMRRDKAMKMYKVTTVDQYHYKRVFTIAAKSQYEALTKASVSSHENVLTIEEVR